MARNGKFGDWAKVELMFAGAGRRFKKNVGRATGRNGRLLKGAIVSRIEDQKFSLPLSPRYLAWKLKHGYSENILVLTGTLMSNIQFEQESWVGGVVTVTRHEPNKNYDIGWIMEHGSRDGRVPARPFVAPGLEDARRPMVRNYEWAVEETFR